MMPPFGCTGLQETLSLYKHLMYVCMYVIVYIHQNYSVISFRYFLQNYLDSKEYQNRVPLKCRYYHFSCDFFDTFPKVVFSVSEYFAQRLVRPFDKNGQKKIRLSFWPSLSYFWPNFGVIDWISLAFGAKPFPQHC